MENNCKLSNKNAIKHGVFAKNLSKIEQKLFKQFYSSFANEYHLDEFRNQLIVEKIIKLEVLLQRIEGEISKQPLGKENYLMNYYSMFLTQQRKWLLELNLQRKDLYLFGESPDIAFVRQD